MNQHVSSGTPMVGLRRTHPWIQGQRLAESESETTSHRDPGLDRRYGHWQPEIDIAFAASAAPA